MRRREFLKVVGGGAAGALLGGWPGAAGAGRERASTLDCVDPGAGGPVRHVLASVNPYRILVKASFAEPLPVRPTLRVGKWRWWGQPTDSAGRFWRFDARGLQPGTRYELEIAVEGCPVHGPWELATFPLRDARPEHLRVLFFTCAGGHDLHRLYVPVPTRQRLLRRGLAFAPDAVVAHGDHVYWDLRSLPSAIFQGLSPVSIDFAGEFDREAPILGSENEAVLKRCVDGQLADLYGTDFQGVPVFFVRDDHDYFEDDRAGDDLVTFPADAFMRELARTTQRLYYPEYLPEPSRPFGLPGTYQAGYWRGLSEAFGTLRYGRLVEMLLYDCKGFATLGGEAGGLVPDGVEAWLVDRMRGSDADHVVNVPSNPIGYSAGKYAEWYPDVVDGSGLTDAIPKRGWQPGWLRQHDRLLRAASERGGIAAFLSGDIHSIAEELVVRSGDLDLSANPVLSLVSGTPGTRFGWPSLARNVMAMPPTAIEAEPVVPVEEVNGFHLVDFEPDTLTIRHFRWDFENDPVEAIDALEPFHVSVYRR